MNIKYLLFTKIQMIILPRCKLEIFIEKNTIYILHFLKFGILSI